MSGPFGIRSFGCHNIPPWDTSKGCHMLFSNSTTPAKIKETKPSKSERFSGPIPMSAEVQAQPAIKPNKRGKTPTVSLIQRGLDKAQLNKTALTSLEKSVSGANRGEVYWPTAKIKAGLAEGKMELIREGLGDLIELTVTEAPKVTPKKTTKAPKVVAEKAPKEPKAEEPKAEEPKAKEPKAKEPKAKRQSLAQRKMAAIEALVAQNAEIIALLK